MRDGALEDLRQAGDAAESRDEVCPEVRPVEVRPDEDRRDQSSAGLAGLPGDTRGILAPAAMMRHVRFRRWDPPEPLTGLVTHFWAVEWDFPEGFSHRQDVLPFPAVNVSIGNAPPAGADPGPGPYPPWMYITGVTRKVSPRLLTGSGRNVAMRSTIGGFGAWIDDVSALNESAVDVAAMGMDTDPAEVHALTLSAAGERLAELLIAALERRPVDRVRTAREITAWTDAAERDRNIRTVEQWAQQAGVTVRTMQRLFTQYVGVSPMWVIRRFRLLEAIERVRAGESVSWAEVAAELGYADQAHLTRAFTAAIGESPAGYAARQR